MATAKIKKLFPLFKRDPEVHEKFMMTLAIEEAKRAVKVGDGPPFGAAIAKDKRVVCRGRNEVLKRTDPTAHAEFVAIQKACKILGTDNLEGCVLYSSCEPCPMCLSLCAMLKVEKIYYGASMTDANKAGYKKASSEFYKNLKKKDFFEKSFCRQMMASHANITLRQLVQESEKLNEVNNDVVADAPVISLSLLD